MSRGGPDPGVVGTVLGALADPTRRLLLDALAEKGQASATTLAGRLPVSRQAVVKHLQVLEEAGLVRGVRAGREVLYTVRPAPLDASARWLADLATAWDRRLTALKRAAEAPDQPHDQAGDQARDQTFPPGGTP
ncbi:ArsR/SmtB family transcription factor [Nonomuraea jiangxiensis]|uniref:DNA-binding transcriptional regulator, ArsR family n=1 Tax=Nonomuraea jiangxiensis TaxID=633440 RepID=A0A1G9D6L0_9ACTN|nr:metalloregulator ArsR/SmtB family transcription factor [Nonomuraea jiangxiensis]SDK59481.1 DNA-binding transcriptional regulator, ArsR family [Nonomuraea jiangxiensis]